MNPNDLREKAYNLGKHAFHNGMKAIPVYDTELMKMLEGNKVGEGLPLLKAWNRGWHEENIKATPVR